MIEQIFSITMDKRQASKEFAQLSIDQLVLALLARHPPKPEWNGCLVYEGEAPGDELTTHCIAVSGPHADEIQEMLVRTMESLNIPVLGVYEGGPEVRIRIAQARNDTWDAA